jgi:hypothetical protein
MSDNLAIIHPFSPATIEGIVIATVVGFDHERVLVQLPDQPLALVVSQSCGRRLDASDVGAEVALTFVGGDPARPIILDKIARPAAFSITTIHHRELVFEADRQITLRCGKSSLTLTRDGKIVISGKDLLSRASSVNRIRGGVIQLN